MAKDEQVYGLILSGGKSTRMGADKGLLEYHGKPHREYLYELAQSFCKDVFFSVRKDQEKNLKNDSTIIDRNEYRGPFNGILSAHALYPEATWLVLACDLPLIDSESISKLISERDVSKHATALATSRTKLPEPLAAIWEPHGLHKAIGYLKTAESSCPRKFLLNSDIKLAHPKTDDVLYNANSKEEFEHIKSVLKI